MSKIKSKDTISEIIVRKFLFSKGFRYRLYDKRYPGKPDIVLPKYKTIIFIHGCFWHGHKDCKRSKLPKTKEMFWREKILNNIERDKKNINELVENGWNVIVIWECELSNKTKQNNRLNKLIYEIDPKYNSDKIQK